MFVIRKAQLEALGHSRRRIFENQAVERSKTRGTLSGGDDDSIRGFVQQGIRTALGYGFRNEDHILRFIDMLPGLGAVDGGAPSEPWAIEILTDAELSPAVRIALLEQRVRQRDPAVAAP